MELGMYLIKINPSLKVTLQILSKYQEFAVQKWMDSLSQD